MKKMATLAWIAAIAVAALGLFHVKYQVQRLESDLTQIQREIQDQQEAIHVLKAEWSFLNRPARIADLATRHLGLEPMAADRFTPIGDLPRRAKDLKAASAEARQ